MAPSGRKSAALGSSALQIVRPQFRIAWKNMALLIVCLPDKMRLRGKVSHFTAGLGIVQREKSWARALDWKLGGSQKPHPVSPKCGETRMGHPVDNAPLLGGVYW